MGTDSPTKHAYVGNNINLAKKVGVGIMLALPKQILYQSSLKPSAIATHGEQQQSVSQVDQCSEIATKDSSEAHGASYRQRWLQAFRENKKEYQVRNWFHIRVL
uniref:Uncharacterized protein n=1 Tax=Cannabis sativa TaxID=3483 RepID=A0A803PI42_CANSA